MKDARLRKEHHLEVSNLKKQVDLATFAQSKYGIAIDDEGRARCPFNNSDEANCSLQLDKRQLTCTNQLCLDGADMIELVMVMDKVDFTTAKQTVTDYAAEPNGKAAVHTQPLAKGDHSTPSAMVAAGSNERADRKEAALLYARDLGWAVFPLHSVRSDRSCTCGKADCGNVGKHPRTQHGYKDATTDADRINQYWTQWPDANIGVTTGAVSGIVAIDVDAVHDGENSLEDLQADIGSFPDTVEQQTGSGGRHLIFKHPGKEVPCSAGALGSGLDVRADGGYVLVAPSRNRNGPYTWENSSHPLKIPIADLPPALLEKLTSRNGRADGHAPLVEGPIPEGQRNETLMSFSGSMRDRGMGEMEILAAIVEVNKRCTPPLEADELTKIAASAAKYAPTETARSVSSSKSKQESVRTLVMTPASSIETKATRWLWTNRVPTGEITLTVGMGGVGKSTFHTWMIAQITNGMLSGLHHGAPRPCIICASEDSWGRTIVPRLIAAKANLDLVYRVDVVEAGETVRLTLPADIEALASEIEARQVALVSLDPVMSLISGTIDTHKDHEVRQALEPLAKLADGTGCSILGNGHFNKASCSDPMMRITGSAAFGQVVRAVLAFAKDGDTGECVISQGKNNLGRLDLPSLAYRIESVDVVAGDGPTEVGELVFAGESSRSVQEILGDGADHEARSALEGASGWLESVLQGAPTRKQEIVKWARGEGIANRTLDRAAEELGVVSERDESERGRPATWRLPDYAPGITRQTALADNQEAKSSEVGAPETTVSRQPPGVAGNPALASADRTQDDHEIEPERAPAERAVMDMFDGEMVQ
jgi:hypothetical protein